MTFEERTLSCSDCGAGFALEYIVPETPDGATTEVEVRCPDCAGKSRTRIPLGTLIFVVKALGAPRILPPPRTTRLHDAPRDADASGAS